MWFDGNGFKHNGPSPYVQRKLAKLRANMTFEEKYKEKVEDACRWLDCLLYSDPNAENVIVRPFTYTSKKDIINDFRKLMQMD